MISWVFLQFFLNIDKHERPDGICGRKITDSGAILVEVIFSYPGIGYKLYQAVQSKDYFVIQGIVLVLIFAIALAMLVMDLIYPLIDPRISHGRR